ncbi:MAG: LytTR family DNA-binding domain-containing protein [Rhodothermales bacterium]|nr:LytTR family DNA-binding domain-containing protein [Rhodothermales bacterium]
MKPSPALRALIVDDERLARQELRFLLREFADVETVGEAATVESAARLAGEARPDVVFLDVHMQGETGFDLLPHLRRPVRVVFVTGHDEYAVRAFEANALDYLLKPVLTERLVVTVERLLRAAPRAARAAGPSPLDDTIFLRYRKQARFVQLRDVVFISAAGDYSEVTTIDGERALVLCSLKQWEQRLPDEAFVRIHRSTIVHLGRVRRIESMPDNACRVHVEGQSEPLRMSRRYASKIKLNHGLLGEPAAQATA